MAVKGFIELAPVHCSGPELNVNLHLVYFLSLKHCKTSLLATGSAISNGRVPKSCLGRVFNFKLGRVATMLGNCISSVQPLLELKTWPKVHPVS